MVGSIKSLGCSENETMLCNWSHNDGKYRISEDNQRSENGDLFVPWIRYHVAPNEDSIIFQVNFCLENFVILSLERISLKATILIKCAFVISKLNFLNLKLSTLAQGGVEDRILKFGFISLDLLLRIQTLRNERGNDH